MEQHIADLVEIAGNKNRYQYFIAILCFLFWLNLTSLNFSLCFLENRQLISYYDKESNETIVESLSYEICDKEGSIDYTIVETYKYSWVIDLGLECSKLKVSFIGFCLSTGAFLGALTYSFFTKRFGEKKVIIFCNAAYTVILLISIFVNNYWYYLFTVCSTTMCTNIVEYSVFIVLCNIIPKAKKSIFSTFVNSALGFGGIFYVLMYLACKDWKYVFIVTLVICVVLEILAIFFFIDSMEFYLSKKNYEGFLKALRFIAKINGKSQEFEKELNTEKYRNVLFEIKGEVIELPTTTPRTELIKTPAKELIDKEGNENHKNGLKIFDAKEDINEKKVEINGLVSPQIELQQIQAIKPTEVDGNENGGGNVVSEVNIPTDQQIQNNNNDIQTSNLSKQNRNTSEEKLGPLSLLKYKSVRCTFLLFCLFWFCTSAMYSGLTIGVKSLPGNIYVNSLLLFVAETPGYYVAGLVMNTKTLGRKFSLITFTAGFAFMCLMLVILFNYEVPTIVFYLITRFCVMTAFCIYYTFCLESYPLSVNKMAYGLNGACNSFGGMIVPFIIEYIERRTLYLIYCIVGGVCAGLMVFLNETRGKVIPDQIKEIEEKEKGGIPKVEV